MGKRGSFKLYPETYAPAESRRICATVLQAVKGGDNKESEGDVKSKFGLNAFYDNPMFLREVRSNALKFVARMISNQGIRLTGKPFVKKDMMHLNERPMFPEYLVPDDETVWPSVFPLLGEILRRAPAPDEGTNPPAKSIMEDLYVASKGLVFPQVDLSSHSFSSAT
jgi:hypothetical protein